jgi:hypothetical protein
VYGIVRTSPPQQQQQQQQDNVVRVRDPAKEIYGLLRDRTNGRGPHGRHPPAATFGTVRTHAPAKSESTYLDALVSILSISVSDENFSDKFF